MYGYLLRLQTWAGIGTCQPQTLGPNKRAARTVGAPDRGESRGAAV